MSDDLLRRARRLDTCIFPTERSKCLCGELADRVEKLEAGEIEFDRIIGEYASENARFRDRIEELETALLNIVATFGYGSSGGAYKSRYFSCLEIAKAKLKHLGLKGNYSNYVKYVDARKALEGKDD